MAFLRIADSQWGSLDLLYGHPSLKRAITLWLMLSLLAEERGKR